MNDPHHRPHTAHRRSGQSGGAEAFPPEQLPSQLLHAESERERKLLEDLDDAIFSALTGNEQDLAQAQILWPRAAGEVGETLLEESREHYLRFAVAVLQRLEQQSPRKPEKCVIVLELISLLTSA